MSTPVAEWPLKSRTRSSSGPTWLSIGQRTMQASPAGEMAAVWQPLGSIGANQTMPNIVLFRSIDDAVRGGRSAGPLSAAGSGLLDRDCCIKTPGRHRWQCPLNGRSFPAFSRRGSLLKRTGPEEPI